MKTKLTQLVFLMFFSSLSLAGGGSSVGDGPRKFFFTKKESKALFWALEEISMKSRYLEISSLTCVKMIIPNYPVTCDIEDAEHNYHTLGGKKAKAVFEIMNRYFVPKDPKIVGTVTLELENLHCKRFALGSLLPTCWLQ